jgi:Xaa-Pro dipeptidase
METMQPTLKRGRDVWDQVNMPKAEFLERVGKIRGQMQQRGIDVFLAYSNSGNEYGDVCYLSNYIMKMPQGAVVAITRSGEVTLICEGFARDLPGVKSITWVENIRSCDNASRETVAFLKEKKLISSTIGVAGIESSMPYEQFQSFSESTEACKLLPADDLVREMRLIKSPKEVDQIRRASRLVSRIFDHLCQTSFPGANEKHMEAVISRDAYIEGAEDARMLIARPRGKNWALRPFEEIPLASNQTIILYLGVEFERYWAEGIRTFVLKDNGLTEAKIEAFTSLYGQILEGVTPGKQISKFCRDAMDGTKTMQLGVISEYGMGQGIGLSLQESPLLSEEEPNALREGMCLTLRLAVKNTELGAIMRGETIHLSKTGPEVLTRL